MSEQTKWKELRAALKEQPEPMRKKMALIYDGKQYSVRIPREFSAALDLDKEKDKFEFMLEMPVPLRGEKPKLT
ncbi:MAG: hypothetical protein NTY90_04175, partial [Candidatus Micrarchaeota archaeon]|nr:hypothetical protein [Candidatus Micrarchaeota archaeon]